MTAANRDGSRSEELDAALVTPRRRGIGLACSDRGVSLGAEGVDAAGAIVSVQTDGSVIVSSGITDMGQGAQTQMSQIAAEVLGISMDRIPGPRCRTLRLLHSRHVAEREDPLGLESASDRNRNSHRHFRQPLPLHRLPANRAGDLQSRQVMGVVLTQFA